ncbi:MAG: MFS transporter [Promethearchaeota archaeon]
MSQIETQRKGSIVKEKASAVLQKDKRGYRRNIPILYILNTMVSLHFFGSVMIAFFEDWGGIDFAQIMLLESLFTGAIFVFEIPTGTIADKFGRKISMNLGFIVNAFAVLVYVSFPNFYIFATGEVIWALSVALQSGAYEAMVYDTLIELGEEKRSKKIFSRMKSFGLGSMMIGTISGAWIASVWSLQATMFISVFPLLIAFVLSFMLKEPTVHQKSHQDKPWVIFKKGFHNIKENRELRNLIADSVILSIIAYYIIWLWQERLLQMEVNMAYFGLIQAGMILFQIIFLNMIIPMEKLLGSKKGVVQGSGVAIGIGFILFGAFTQSWIVIAGALIAAGFGMSRRVLLENYMQKHIPSEQRATTLSTVSMFRMLLLMLINPLVGVLTQLSIVWVSIGLGILAMSWSILTPVKEKYLND